MQKTSKVRTAILDAATKLFGQYGYEKTSVDQITKLANRAKSCLYYHFDSKLSIFRCCLEEEFKNLKERMIAIRAEHNDNNNAACLAQYLTERMEMLPKMAVYRSYVSGLTLNLVGGELKETTDEIRRDFDIYEYWYFHDTALKGREVGVFSEKVSPDAFARMLIMVLRGLEIQFFVGKDLESMRSTFESMIELLVLNPARQQINSGHYC